MDAVTAELVSDSLGMVTPAQVKRRREAAERLATLTSRESQILTLVSEGMSNAEIGRRLHMSETTIKRT
ncbi:MAG TPA: LuxR C-terminal-related transcriptional regulator [Pilimelia sp.]|nr:LuxR C-terminal-related transcriptional regulator [Pilimelia sp.]